MFLIEESFAGEYLSGELSSGPSMAETSSETVRSLKAPLVEQANSVNSLSITSALSGDKRSLKSLSPSSLSSHSLVVWESMAFS